MKNKNICIIASTFYNDLSDQLINGAIQANTFNCNVDIIKVPGAFEIPGMVKHVLDYKKPDLIITLGVLIKGESDHFEYISSSVSNSISQLTITSKIPIIFGILTTHNMEQAIKRAYINKKNKGGEAMNAGLEMLKLYDEHKK
jgi:6,7-dimethyl-8-ribityllumazine synthase|tara:strand:+ start:95 stop:523 length:429 start_codon:yes stop_codon:yes gene_type:complete